MPTTPELVTALGIHPRTAQRLKSATPDAELNTLAAERIRYITPYAPNGTCTRCGRHAPVRGPQWCDDCLDTSPADYLRAWATRLEETQCAP